MPWCLDKSLADCVEDIVLDSEEVDECKIVVPENKIVVADPALVDTKRLR